MFSMFRGHLRDHGKVSLCFFYILVGVLYVSIYHCSVETGGEPTRDHPILRHTTEFGMQATLNKVKRRGKQPPDLPSQYLPSSSSLFFIMAVVLLSDLDQPATIMSGRALFLGLFFGLGGGMLLLIIFAGLISWRLVRTGRIRLGVGGPGEFDDEERLFEEEASAIQQMDPSQQEAYYRAKGESQHQHT